MKNAVHLIHLNLWVNLIIEKRIPAETGGLRASGRKCADKGGAKRDEELTSTMWQMRAMEERKNENNFNIR